MALQNSSGCMKLIQSDESIHFNIIFRIGIGMVLFPHCFEELCLMDDRIVIYEEHAENMSLFMVGLHYFIIIIESVFTIILCIGYSGRLSASLLGTSISLHFLPMYENILRLFLFKYEVYILIYPILFFLIITGSGSYSVDAIISKFILEKAKRIGEAKR